MMADHHKGYVVPIGGVLAYQEHIAPSGVDFDIACGNKAVKLDIQAPEVKKHIKKAYGIPWNSASVAKTPG